MLESAGRGYLNQPFSDDASSQESLHSETISFTAPSTEHNHQHHKDVSRKQRSSSSRRSSEPVTGFQSKSKGKKNQEKEKRRTIAARSTSPKEANLPALPEQQNGSNRYRAVSPKQPQQSRKQFRNPLQQAASFDAVNSSQTRDSSRTKQGCNSSLLVAARLVPSTSRVICKRAWSRQEHHRDRLSLVVRIYPPVLIWFPRNFSVPIRHQSPLTAPAVQPYVLHLPLPQPFELSFHRHLQEVRVLS